MTDGPDLTKEEAAYTRYADNLLIDPKQRLLYQFPRGKPYQQINTIRLYKVQKPSNHMEILKREKPFYVETFFGPFDLKESNLKRLFADKKAY